MTLDEELFDAVEKRDPEKVRNLLLPAKTANIEATDENGDNVLHQAAYEGKSDVVRVLTETDRWKEIVDIKGYLGWTALHNCCVQGHTETIKLLLDNKANPEVTDQAGWTPLHHAVQYGYLAAVKLLVERQENLNQKTKTSGGTALHIAAQRGFARIVRTLIDKNADKSATASDGETVLHWALEGAIMAGQIHSSEDDTGDEVHNASLDDEVVSFDDDGASQLNEYFGLEERAEDEPEKYDEIFEHILKTMRKREKWSELLKVARREEKMETLQHLMRKMYPRQIAESLQTPLRRIWLAMRKSRAQELMEMLWKEACEARTPELMGRLRGDAREAKTQELMEKLRTEAHEARTPEQLEKLHMEARDTTETMKKWDSMEKWDILSLATSLGKVHTVYWLLRGHIWSKSDIAKAKNLPVYYRLNRNERLLPDDDIWITPFVHDERSGGESYRWPTDDPDRSILDRFGATIMDFHKVDNQIDSIYYDCGPWTLMDEHRGPEKSMEKSMESLKNQKAGGMVTDEYGDKSRSYRWIHLAINSVPWMKDLAMISHLNRGAKRDEWMATWQFLRRSWQELPENRDEESYMRPNCLKEYLPQLKPKTGKESPPPKQDESMRLALALYMPYLTFGPFENTPQDKDLEDKHKGGILHRSRTLDQFYHSVQDSDRARDKDQVFTRFAKRKRRPEWESDKTRNQETEQTQNGEEDEINFDILRVNQLWLWVIDDSTVITSTTHGLENTEDPVFQGFRERLCQSQTMFNREATPSSVDGFVKLITSFYINAMDNLKVPLEVSTEQQKRGNSDDPRKADGAHQQNSKTDATKTSKASLTTVFADSIENNNGEERKLRQDFREAMNGKTSRSGNLHDDIVKTMEVLDDIKDIRDELNIINSVVQEQKTVWSQLFKQSRGSSMRDDASKEGHERYQWSNTDPDYVLKRVKDLLREAEETEHNITSVLELEMNQLNVSEAEEARKQGETIMTFTIITAVFLPLSFLASLFALNVSIFPHSGNDVLYQPGWIFGIMFGATLAFVLFLLLTVFREVFFGMIAKVFTKFQELLPKASQPTEEQRDESKPTAGENGHDAFRKQEQPFWRRWRRTDSGGERATPEAAQRGPHDPPV